jgi:2,3-bisphosphoglycerate-independent phosphoglycerate mutase
MVSEENNIHAKSVTLVILDGFGLAESGPTNAISTAKMPNFDSYLDNYPVMSLKASGEAVGLFGNQAGDSSLGHLTLGAGREVLMSTMRIRRSIADGSFFANPVLLEACDFAKNNKGALHLAGLVAGGDDILASDHYLALLEFAKQQSIKKVFFHVFLKDDSRRYLEQLEKKIEAFSLGQISSVIGVDFAHDLTGAWQKTEKIYSVMTSTAKNKRYDNLEQAFNDAENNQLNLNSLPPVLINVHGSRTGRVKAGDSLIFFDCADGSPIQLLKSFVLPSFVKFKRPEYLQNLFVASLIPQIVTDLPIKIAFPEEEIINSLAQVISDSGLKQVKIAETSKYVYATYFFNGKQKNSFNNEEQVLIPAHALALHDDPLMATAEIASAVLRKIETEEFSFIGVNIASPDEVAHTGDFSATVMALEAVDKALGKIVEKVLAHKGVVIITADHGNAENVSSAKFEDRQHTISPVPMIIIGKDFFGKVSKNSGNVSDLLDIDPTAELKDVAPTILKILGLKRPEEMTGKPLI